MSTMELSLVHHLIGGSQGLTLCANCTMSNLEVCRPIWVNNRKSPTSNILVKVPEGKSIRPYFDWDISEMFSHFRRVISIHLPYLFGLVIFFDPNPSHWPRLWVMVRMEVWFEEIHGKTLGTEGVVVYLGVKIRRLTSSFYKKNIGSKCRGWWKCCHCTCTNAWDCLGL